MLDNDADASKIQPISLEPPKSSSSVSSLIEKFNHHSFRVCPWLLLSFCTVGPNKKSNVIFLCLFKYAAVT